MSDNLTIFGDNYTNVTGIKANGTGNGMLAYIRPQGTKSITENGTGIDVAQYANVDVDVHASSAVIEPLIVTPTTSQQVIQATSRKSDTLLTHVEGNTTQNYAFDTVLSPSTVYFAVLINEDKFAYETYTDPIEFTIPSGGYAKVSHTVYPSAYAEVYEDHAYLKLSTTYSDYLTLNVYESIAVDGYAPVTVEPIPSNYGLITWDGSVLTVS